MDKVNCGFCGKLLSKTSLRKHELSPICRRAVSQEGKSAHCPNCKKYVLKSNMSHHRKTKLCREGGRQARNEKKRLAQIKEFLNVKSSSQLRADAPIREDVTERLDESLQLIREAILNNDHEKAITRIRNISNIVQWAKQFHDPYLEIGANYMPPRPTKDPSVIKYDTFQDVVRKQIEPRLERYISRDNKRKITKFKGDGYDTKIEKLVLKMNEKDYNSDSD